MLSIKYDVYKSEITIKLCRINITTLSKLVITIFLTYALKTFHDSYSTEEKTVNLLTI